MPKSVEIVVPKKGFSKGTRQISIEAFGYLGQTCKTATEAFERALGSVQEVEEKSEMHQQEQGVERLDQGGE